MNAYTCKPNLIACLRLSITYMIKIMLYIRTVFKHLLKLPLKLKQNSKISNGSKCKYYITLFFLNVFSKKNRSENEKVLNMCKRKDPPPAKVILFYTILSPPPPGLISLSMPELNKMHSR